MASAGDIGLDAYKNGELKRNELMFGKAKCFTYTNKVVEACEVCESYVLKDMETLKIEWLIEPGRRVNHPVDMTLM